MGGMPGKGVPNIGALQGLNGMPGGLPGGAPPIQQTVHDLGLAPANAGTPDFTPPGMKQPTVVGQAAGKLGSKNR